MERLRIQKYSELTHTTPTSGSFAQSSPLTYNLAMDFQLVTSYKPRRDQPRAIDELLSGLAADGTWGARLLDSHA
jgi:hypothetical protein